MLMLGGRRCGKTSILAAVQDCFETALMGTPFVINTESDVTNTLADKRAEILMYFRNKGQDRGRSFVPDSNPSFAREDYTFRIALKGSSSCIKLNFTDVPGEWMRDNGHRKDLESLIARSRILLIAIDTPHMMEEKGIFNEYRNNCYNICEMIKSVGFADAAKGAGMILLVPLKCERYRNDNCMERVAAQTAEAYQPLIRYINQPGMNGERSLCQVAVTPIFTMGGAAFSRFERDSEMEIIIDEKFHTPKNAIYYFPDMTKEKPEPKYCEQPLLYVLDFTLSAAQSVLKKGKNPLAKLTDQLAKLLKNAPVNPLFAIVAEFLSEGIALWGGTEDYLAHAEDIRKRKKYEGDGYRVLIGAVPGGKH